MFGQSLLSAFGIACTTDTDQLFVTTTSTASLATYQLNNATTSIPSNTYPGTASNITYGTGKFGNAASFNGSSSYIRLPANFLNSSTQTISMWVNPSSVSGNKMLYSSYDYQTGPSKGTYVRLNSGGQIQLTVHDGDCGTMYPDNPSCTAVTQLVSPSAIPINTWTHIVGVIGGSGNPMTIYINGVNVVSTPTMRSVGYWSGKQPLIGATDYVVNGTSYPPEGFFNGSIDQVRFFSSALSQAAITALYNETTTTATYAYVDYVGANPNSVAYYKMSDATDQFGNYNGTASNVNFNTEGKFGFAGAFNGSSSSILLPNDILSSDFSISTWFYLNNTSGDQLLFEFDHENRVMFRVASTDSNKAYIGNSGYFDPGISFSANQWYHFVLTFSNGNPFKIYVNNVLSYTGGNTNTNAFNNDNIFGAANVSGGGSINGKIDQVRIFNSAISAANVKTLYEEIECPEVAVTNAFNTVLYTGDDVSHPITGVGFKPDFTWIKRRVSGSESHALYDIIRGVNKQLSSDLNAAEATNTAPYEGFTSFDNNGFTVDNNGATNRAPNTYVAWNWKAGGAAVTNSVGTNANSSEVSADVAAGFSIVKVQADGTNNTIGHGLGGIPELIISKNTGASGGWGVYSAPTGIGHYMYLNQSSAVNVTFDGTVYPSVSSTTFAPGSGGWNYTNGNNYIHYLWRSIPGYSRVGSYTWSNTSYTAGTMVAYLGFTPRFVMIKGTDVISNWQMYDNKRVSGTQNYALYADLSDVESTSGYQGIKFDSNGFSAAAGADGNVTGSTSLNQNGKTYIYLAIA